MYEVSPSTLTLPEPTSILNIGTFESEPIITVYGQGDITLIINNLNIILNAVEEKITINSEILNAYNETFGKLYITDGEFLNSLQLGNFVFEPRTNGNLSFYKNKK